MLVTKQKSVYTPFPPGVYTMNVQKVEEGTSTSNGRPFFRWFIRIEDQLSAELMKNHKEPVFTVLTSTDLTERNNFGRFLNVIGHNLAVGEGVETDQLIGHRFVAKVTVVTKNGKENNNLDMVSVPEYEAYKKSQPLAA